MVHGRPRVSFWSSFESEEAFELRGFNMCATLAQRETKAQIRQI